MSYNQGSGYTAGFGSNISFGAITYNGGTGTVSVYNSGAGAVAAHVMQTIDISSPETETGDIKITNNDSPTGGNPAGTHEYAPGMTGSSDDHTAVVACRWTRWRWPVGIMLRIGKSNARKQLP